MLTRRKASPRLAAIGLAILLLVGTVAAKPNPAPAESGQQIVLTIEGLACPYCAYGLRKRLLIIPGVSGVELFPDASRVVIKVAPGSDVENGEIREAISSAHFSSGEITHE